MSDITFTNSTEQDAEYQVTPGPPFPDDPPPWVPIAARTSQTVSGITLPVLVQFRIPGVPYYPAGGITAATPAPDTAELAKWGQAFVVLIS
jgi:hypothetical protein